MEQLFVMGWKSENILSNEFVRGFGRCFRENKERNKWLKNLKIQTQEFYPRFKKDWQIRNRKRGLWIRKRQKES